MTRRIHGACLAGGLLAAALGTTAQAEDWPQWGRDLSRNMYSPARNLPDRFDPGLSAGGDKFDPAKAKNVKWVAKLGSQTYGNPVVSQGRVLVGTNNDSPRDPQHQGDRSILLCLDEKTGDLLWQLVVPKLKSGKVNDWESLGLLCSPKVEGNRVYLVTSRCEVMCLDLNGQADGNDGPFQEEDKYFVKDTGKPPAKVGPKDADIIWVYDIMDELGVFPHNASNSAPLILGDAVFVCTSNGQDWTHVNVPSPLSPSFIALDKRTGKLLGEDDAEIGKRLFHGQWTSGSAGQVNGRWLVFFGGGDGWCYALETKPVAKDDRQILPIAWKADCNPPEYRVKDGKPIKYPNADGPSEINATPVFYKNRVYVAIGQDPEHGEGIGNLVCLDATKSGDITKTGLIWSYNKIHRSISSVSIDPDTGLLFVGDFSGFVHCLDAETGSVYWVHDMKAHMWGSTLVADGKVYVGSEDGDLVVLAAAKEKKIISQTNLGAPIYATPIVANATIYVGTQTYLYALHNAAMAAPAPDQPRRLELKKE
jgi:outer membrane protein assembly factor BamB